MTTAAQDWATAAEDQVLDHAVALAPEEGWGAALFRRASGAAGFSLGEAELLMPNGARDLAALLSRRHDRAGLAALATVDPATLKIRERIRTGVIARLDAAAADREAVRRCAGFLSLPQNLPLASRLIWETANGIWRWAGDTATDENHYTKRVLLAGILTAVHAIDLSGDREGALAQLDARIANVMAFEKWKAGVKPADLAHRMAGALARMRYGRG